MAARRSLHPWRHLNLDGRFNFKLHDLAGVKVRFVHRLNVFGSLLGIFRDHLAEGTGKKVSVFLFEEMTQVQGHVQVGVVVKVLGFSPWDIG